MTGKKPIEQAFPKAIGMHPPLGVCLDSSMIRATCVLLFRAPEWPLLTPGTPALSPKGRGSKTSRYSNTCSRPKIHAWYDASSALSGQSS
jgi:hypothetical protein